MKLNLNDKKAILKNLQETGFPLEVAVSNTLDALDMRVDQSRPYIDPETKKMREIDIHALDFYPNAEEVFIGNASNKKRLIIHYIIECKNNQSNAFVFFANDTNQRLWPVMLGLKTEDEEESQKKKTQKYPDAYFYLENKKIKEALKKFQSHSQLHVAFTEIPPRDKSHLYDAVSSLIKAYNFYWKRYATRKVIHLFVPIIVVSDHLWSARMNGSHSYDKIALTKAKYIIATYNTLKEEKYSDSILFFIVKEKYLKNFVINFRELGKVINSEWSMLKGGQKKSRK